MYRLPVLTAERLFLSNTLLRRALMNGGWVPLSVRLVVDLEFSAFQLLLMGVAIESAILLGEVPTGVVADVFSRKWSVVLGAFFLSLAQFCSGLVDQWELYLVTQFVWGIGWTFISGAEIAWVTDEVGRPGDVERLLLRVGRLQLVAIVIGTLCFGLLSLVAPLTWCVMIAGGIGFAWTAFLAVAMPETGFERATENHLSAFTTTLRTGAAFTWAHRGLRALGGALIVGGIAAEAIDRLDLRRLEDLGLSSEISPVLVFGAVVVAKSLLGAALLWRYEHRVVGQSVVPGFAMLMALIAVAAMALAHVPVLAIAAVLLVVQGGLLDMTAPLINTWANALAPDDARATVHSFIGQARSIGEIVGGVGLGLVASVATLPTAWTVAAVLFFASAVIANSARRHWTVA